MWVRLGLILLGLLCLPASVYGQVYPNPIRFGWDPSATATGYKLYLDTLPGLDVGPTLASMPLVLALGPHVVSVTAYNAAGESPKSAAIPFSIGQLVDPACVAPLGNRAVSIFVTSLQKTGSGGPLSKAYLNFQVSSPQSPITHLAVRANGQDLPEGTMDGGPPAYLNASPGLWFVIPASAGTYPLSVRATNLYGCTNDVSANKTLTVP